MAKLPAPLSILEARPNIGCLLSVESIVNLALAAALGARVPTPPPQHETGPSSAQWIEAADFLMREDDREEFLRLQDKILRERPADIPLVTKVLEFQIRNKDRKALLEIMTRLNTDLHCNALRLPKLRRPACDELRRLWFQNLDSVLFFETSAQRLQEARALMAQKDCPAAINVLKEVEAREGASKQVLILLEEGQKCTGDTEAAGNTVRRLEEIRIFASGANDA